MPHPFAGVDDVDHLDRYEAAIDLGTGRTAFSLDGITFEVGLVEFARWYASYRAPEGNADPYHVLDAVADWVRKRGGPALNVDEAEGFLHAHALAVEALKKKREAEFSRLRSTASTS